MAEAQHLAPLCFENVMITPLGGVAVRMTNKTGADSVKGTLVEPSSAADNAVAILPADDYDPIGIIYEDGVADGDEVWVVVYGIAEVLLEDTTAATRGYWVRLSATQAGRADATNAAPSGGTITALEDHMQEIGHCIQSVTAGTDKLCKIIMHFN